MSQPLAREPTLRPAGAGEADLLAATARGEERAFAELRGRLRRMIDAVCRSLLGREQVDDCEQEVFAHIWQKAGAYDARRGAARAWAATVARNVTLNLRPRRREDALDSVAEPSVAPVDVVERLWLTEALQRLPAHERHVLELAYAADLSQSQIATLLSLPLGTVKTWTRRGLHHLADQLQDEAP
jgi:RNA polymerase sigma-70 factor (ECF subfamily)